MNNKIHFFGCSVTAGNELWEEQNIPDYNKLSFDDARKVAKHIPFDQITSYNYANSFPALVAKELGCKFENHGIPGSSNKEIAGRAIAHFPNDHYDDIRVFLQLTTHNRMFLRYKENEKSSTVGSFVISKSDDSRLSKSQNNLLKEMFFEFYNETMLAQDDHIYMYYAADILNKKGIKTHILWPAVEVMDWTNWDHDKNCDPGDRPVTIFNDNDPQYVTGISRHISARHREFNFFTSTLLKLVGPESHLPRFHFKKSAHEIIAKSIAEKLKND